jgi:putative membrane protein
MPLVLWQLVRRMRWDLLLMACLVVGSQLLETALLRPRMHRLHLFDGAALSILAIAASIFLAFRNTQAINRWWEARLLWGSVTNTGRHWRDCLRTLLGCSAGLRSEEQRLVSLQVLQVWLLDFELRGHWRKDARSAVDALARSLGLSASLTLQQSLLIRAGWIGQLRQRGLISGWGQHELLRCSEAFTNAVGGLQRIRNTPLPPAYDVIIRLISWLFGYALFLQFSSRGALLAGLLLFLGFLVIERIGSYVEGPFDRDGSSFGMPMDLICSTISADLLGSGHPLARLPLEHDPSLWT